MQLAKKVRHLLFGDPVGDVLWDRQARVVKVRQDEGHPRLVERARGRLDDHEAPELVDPVIAGPGRCLRMLDALVDDDNDLLRAVHEEPPIVHVVAVGKEFLVWIESLISQHSTTQRP